MVPNKFKATLPFWKKLSYYYIIGCGTSIVASMFLSYLNEQFFNAVLVEALTLSLWGFSELMIYILKEKTIISTHWNRFKYFEQAFLTFFIGSLAFRVINTELFNSFFSETTQSLVFWSGLGLSDGFRICKKEYHRALKLDYEQQVNDEFGKTTSIETHWKRFANYKRVLTIFLCIGFFADFINKKLLHSIVPNEIPSYIFWLSLGLYLGFLLCEHEYQHALELYHAQLVKDESDEAFILDQLIRNKDK